MEKNNSEPRLQLPLPAHGLNCRRGYRGRADRRQRWRHASGLRTKAQALKGFRIEFPARIQPMRFLEFFHGIHGRGVPLPVWRAYERTIFGQCLLDFRNPVRSGGFLPPLPPAGSSR
jgi:hypothetical protein